MLSVSKISAVFPPIQPIVLTLIGANKMTSYIEVSIHSEPEDDDHHDLSDLELQQCNSSGSRQHLLQSITNVSKPQQSRAGPARGRI